MPMWWRRFASPLTCLLGLACSPLADSAVGPLVVRPGKTSALPCLAVLARASSRRTRTRSAGRVAQAIEGRKVGGLRLEQDGDQR